MSSLADAAPYSVAHVDIPIEEPCTAAKIKTELKKSWIAHRNETGHF
jgi:hypothetical protein